MKHRLQRSVERQELAVDLFSHLPIIVVAVDLEVHPEQVDDGEIARCLPVRNRTTLED